MDEEELNFIIKQGEGFKTEFKESLKNIDKDLVAFANAEGGKIFLGVSDSGDIKGLSINNRLKSQIQNMARNCDPQVRIYVEKFEDLIIITVEEGEDKPYKCSSGFYLRQGANTQKLSRDEIFQFATKVSKLFFDELPCEEFNFDRDFDYHKFESFLKMAKISDVFDAKHALVNLNLAKKCGKKYVINNTGALLFAKNLNEIYYHTLVTCVRFKGTDRSKILDRKNFNEDLIGNIESSLKFLLQYLPLRYEITSLRRKEYYEIPEDAIREAVVNAIAHRDYFEKGANVQINIFDDRIEITNPGGLVAGLKIEDFGSKSISRNPLLQSILSKTEYVEKIGTGIRRIREALRNQGLKEPQFDFGEFFTITFLRTETPQKTTQKVVARLEQDILNEIKKKPPITRNQIADNLKISPETVKEYLAKLKQKDLLRRVGPDKGGYWEVLQ